MKILFTLLALFNLAAISIGCTREAQQEEDIQREKGIREDDIREDDSYDRSIPIQKEDVDPNIEVLDFETDETSTVE
jgi:hypothetical protein